MVRRPSALPPALRAYSPDVFPGAVLRYSPNGMISSPNGTVSSPDGMVPSDHATVRRVIPLRGARGGHNRRPIAARGSLELRLQPYAVPTALAAVAVLVLGVLALVRERGATVSVTFFLTNLLAAVWLGSYSLVYLATTEQVALWWVKAAHLGVIFIPAAVYHFTVTALRIQPEHKTFVRLGWITSALFFLAMAPSDAFIARVRRYWWGFYPDYEWLSIPFLLFFFGMLAASLRHFWIEYHKAPPGTHKLRTKSLLVAFAIAYIGSIDYVAAFQIALYPFGYLPILGFIAMTARAIHRHRLVDVTPAYAARGIIEAMADALLVLDRDGMVRVVNPAACQLFGSSERQLLGQPIEALTSAISPTGRLGEL